MSLKNLRRAGTAAALAGALAAGGLAVSSPAQAASAVPNTGQGCHGITCIYVNGTGDFVNYATVTNRAGSGITGQCTISNTFRAPYTEYGPTCAPGHAWRVNFNLKFKDQTKICGSVSGLDVACIVIHK